MPNYSQRLDLLSATFVTSPILWQWPVFQEVGICKITKKQVMGLDFWHFLPPMSLVRQRSWLLKKCPETVVSACLFFNQDFSELISW